MVIKVSVLVSYFLLVLGIGWINRTRWKSTPESYFLASRQLRTVILLATMAATNFSAFTMFGTSGAGYRDGYAFFPIMGFGTGFMALSFWVIGRKIRQMGQQYQLVTPPELVKTLYQSPRLSMLFAVVMIVFTIPYLALQPMAAGYVLEELVGLPYFVGCLLVTGIIMLYTLRGGLRAVVWTDLFQGVLMLALLIVSLFLVANHFGGFVAANEKAWSLYPELFSRPGGSGKYTIGIWFSFLMLWFFCDPMFPQLFQRFYAARDNRAIGKTMCLYPLVCTVIFFIPISIGVMGHLAFPDLAGKDADKILPMLLTIISGDAMAALVMAAGIAALMSTMDSQLLTLSSIFTYDILPLLSTSVSKSTSSLPGRIAVLILSMAGLALAYKPPATILQIAAQTFTGLAVLFPTVFFGLYLQKRFATAAIASILAGEGMLILFYLKLIPSGPFLPVVWVLLVAVFFYLAIHFYLVKQSGIFRLSTPAWLRNRYIWLFMLLFVLAHDVWSWKTAQPLVLGVPYWIGYFVLLSLGQIILMYFLVKRGSLKEYDNDLL
ncbi:MAG: Na+/pantothenate symporter PanF [Deltaproteobacteria bacterium]|nr:MAG: Na+/pantothenate symporter PanF [Deltaproteobacteria bacterium]